MAKQTDYVDKMEQEALLDQHTRGKIFEDGPYQYRLYIRSSSFGYGVILTLVNEPDLIDGDLVSFAVERITNILLTKYDMSTIENLHLYFTKIWIDAFGHEENLILSLTSPSVKGFDFKIKDAGASINTLIKAYDLKAFNSIRERKLAKLTKVVDVFLNKTNPIEMDATNTVMYGGLDPDEKVIFRCTANIQTNVVRRKSAGDSILNGPSGNLDFGFSISINVILQDSPLITGMKDHYSVDGWSNILTSQEFYQDYVKPLNNYIVQYFDHFTTMPIDDMRITYAHNPKNFLYRISMN
jgi:hypothetical protein